MSEDEDFIEQLFSQKPANNTENWIRLDPPPTLCWQYGKGTCCYDQHMQASILIPAAQPGWALCDFLNKTLTVGRLTEDRKVVNCQNCLEVLHS